MRSRREFTYSTARPIRTPTYSARSSDVVGTAAAARKLASAAAFGGGGLSVLGAGAVRRAARRGAARPQGDRQHAEDAAARRDRLVRPRPARARRSRSRCSATRARPATASSGSRRRPAPTSPAASPTQADRRVYLRDVRRRRRPVPRPGRPGRRGAADRARRRRHPDRRQRRHPHGAARRTSVRHLSEAVRRLRDAGVEVVVGTCPDLGTDPADRRRRSSRSPAPGRAGSPPRRRSPSSRPAAAPSRSATILGPEFDAAPALLFGPDQFHPSADGYRALAAVLLPSTPGRARPRPRRRGAARGLPRRGRAARRRRGRRGRRAPRAPSSTAPRSAGVAARRTRPLGRAAAPSPPPRRRDRVAGDLGGRGRRAEAPPDGVPDPGSMTPAPRPRTAPADAVPVRVGRSVLAGRSPGCAAGWCRSRPG